MTQILANDTSNRYGTVKRVGNTDNGRVVYQVIEPKGTLVGNLTVPENQADIFEKSFEQVIRNAPKLEQYTTPVQIEKRKRKANWITGISTAILGGIPLIKVKGEGAKGTWKQIGLTALGTISGFIIGRLIAAKITTPAGVAEFAKATETISKLDIKPV